MSRPRAASRSSVASLDPIIPREYGIEGWLWTSTGGSAFTERSRTDEAPNLALVFTQPLEADVVEAAFEPELFEELAKRSPLGSPTVFGVLLRAEKLESARAAFTKFGLVRPLTDREVPPTQRSTCPPTGRRTRSRERRRRPRARSRLRGWADGRRGLNVARAEPLRPRALLAVPRHRHGDRPGGETKEVPCPWCEGSGRLAGHTPGRAGT